MEKLFSILICTLTKRHPQFTALYRLLDMQRVLYKVQDKVEILSLCDNGEMPVGRKRNQLISQAQGKFISFIDDDDKVDGHYIKIITDIIQTNSDIDCIGMSGIYTVDGKNPKKFIHSLQYKNYFEKNGVYYRCPNHLNPIRKDCIKDIKFMEVNYGEDSRWAFDVRDKNCLKKEFMYDKNPLYFYCFSKKTTATQK